MPRQTLAARVRQDGLDLNELYPTPEPRRSSDHAAYRGRRGGYRPGVPVGHVSGWIERGEDPPVNFNLQHEEPAAPAPRRIAKTMVPAWRARLAIALQALRVLLMCIGGVASIAYLAAMPMWLRIAGGALGAVALFSLYKLLSAWRNR